jgi:undecaprenyl-diphosphatase
MEIFQSVLLAIVQGISEWLPISSSGHLLIAQSIMGISVPVSFDILLHVGTLAAVVAVFWKDLLGILSAVVTFRRSDPLFKTGFMLILGSIPTALIGLAVSAAEPYFLSLTSVGVGLIATSLLLFASRSTKGSSILGPKQALLVGIVQGIAVIPGVSRSGSTISSGLIAGVGKADAFRYSMLLSIPAILGALLLKANELSSSGLELQSMVGMVIAAVVGYISIRLLKNTLLSGRFHLFGFYCLAVGAGLVVYSLL